MYRCELGYEIADDLTPPERCHCDIKYEISSCKECNNYNKEYDLINQAIESARCRIYRVRKEGDRASSYEHQVKALNQQELMKVTIKALEYYRDNDEI